MQDETNNNDNELFREAMGDVRPIKQEKRISPIKPRPSPRPRQRELDEQQVMLDSMSDPADLSDLQTGEELLFCRHGLQHKTLKKLRRGDFALQAELDLHGKTVAQARIAIAEFLANCQHQGLRCVRMIHGKGYGSFNKQPVLKSHVNHWLRQRDEVLAFSSARPADGGTGAIYLLLRKN
jgi:DNA-nicking Smr family endonuclease